MSADEKSRPPYRGRFAPSPTGPLHFGSLVAAVGSYLDARSRNGEWLVRIEDIDPPREVAGAADAILRVLDAFGLEWDGQVTYQSRRSEHYSAALDRLRQYGYLYGCACTRKEIADSTLERGTAGVYPGTCRNGILPGRTPRSLRVRVEAGEIRLNDRLQGNSRQSLRDEVGDFIVRRADNLAAYQLAVVVDDAEQEMTHIVRGVDLLESTPRQIYLQQLLELPTPAYLHLPVAVNSAGDKLSKQTCARRIGRDHKTSVLLDVLRFLRQELPDSAADARVDELLNWAINHWDLSSIPARRALTAPPGYSESKTRT
ncbi:MAG: tRNA glutamyl-Q(34) synthetase GluQRS [Gammaproteobacteria bacterium]|nr:tRNA glutamyl-Q(34) synthetase GluQRS [Gammaproteobacteria bacterium]